MDLPSVVKQAAQLLDASFEEEDQAWFLTVTVSESEDEEQDDRTQLVRVELEPEGEVVLVSTDVGPWSEEHDSAEILRLMRDASLFSRVYLSEATDDEPEQLVVESALVADRVDAELLANVIQEVAEVADDLELMLFDSEESEDLDEEDDEAG
jgi:hypothetical protein